MNRLQRHIKHLLISHDCVIVPGIGAVLAHRESACFGASGALFQAPARAFTFNPVLNHNDGLLVSSVARAESISYEAASLIVESEVAAMRSELEEQSRLSLGAIGTLMRGSDSSLRFVAGAPEDISPATMWLPAVDLAVFSESNESSVAAVREIIARPQAPRKRFQRVAKLAAAFAVLVALGLTLMTPLKVDNPQLASLGIESFTSKAESAIFEMPGTSTAPVVLVLERHADAATVVDTTASSVRRMPSAPVHAEKMRYCLVVASLPTEQEARRFVEMRSDDNLGILVKDGRYRVYAAQGETIARVNELAKADGIDGRYPNAWVCRK